MEVGICIPHNTGLCANQFARFEDFAECFPQYVEEDREGAMQTFNQVADYIEAATKVWLIPAWEYFFLAQSSRRETLKTYSRNTTFKTT
jgi:hypothetical protein